MIVKFKDVGRGKQSWEQEIPEPVTEVKIACAAKKALMSWDVDATLNQDGSGSIFVGGFRKVGTFQLAEKVM